jgi:hypothetical protein
VHGSSTLDYDAVPASLADAAVKPGDPAYGRLTPTYFRGGAPGIVLLPRTVAQVVDAVDFAGRPSASAAAGTASAVARRTAAASSSTSGI